MRNLRLISGAGRELLTLGQKVDREVSIPATPGAWLYRFRVRSRGKGDNDRRLSSEELGDAIGVAGRTLLRWESGKSVPNQDDLGRLAEYLELSLFQTTFMKRIFSHDRSQLYPFRTFSGRTLGDLLLTRFPSFVLDEMYFVLRYNHMAKALQPEALLGSEPLHFLRCIVNGLFVDPAAGQELTTNYWFRTVLLDTAASCGSASYQRMAEALSGSPDIARRWVSLILEDHDEGLAITPGAPLDVTSPSAGSWRVFTSTVYCPNRLHVVECVPVDAMVETALRAPPEPTEAMPS